ncbi:D-2-hydroxyacid dehydrogenase [Sporosarcina sp. 179-K 3D1 HS]|uniref:D-2-hydroxyacid dehydrogenase n=1 Tax=Sporosarcina sp. 179-K 3D1 HS TaxID=3232169 RepID=UPI00399FBA73
MNVVFMFPVKEYQKENLLKRFPQVHFQFEQTDEAISQAEILVTYGNDITIQLLEKAKSLEWLMIASAGIEKMPLSYIAERGILMTNAQGIHKIPMAESVLAYMLALRRSLFLMYDRQKKKEWNKRVYSRELRGATALILGPGTIGGEIGRLLQAFGVRTIGCNRSGRDSEWMDETIVFDHLLERLGKADFVISVLPSTQETRGMLTKEYFQAMKESTVFMNFGRGDLFDEADLIEALKTGEIGHAVLDVFETEPLPEESELWFLPNCSISPHASSFSGKYVERSLEIFEANLERWLKGDRDLLNTVDPLKGY